MADKNYDIDLEMLADFIDEAPESLSVIPGLFVEFENNPDNLKLVEAIFRPVHSLKGNAAYFNLIKTKALAHNLESVLDMLRKEKLLPNREMIDGLLAGIDELNDILDRTRQEGRELIDQDRYEKVHARVKALLTDGKSHQPGTEEKEGEDNQERKVLWQGLLEDLDTLGRVPVFEQAAESALLQHIMECVVALAPPKVRTVTPAPASSPNPLKSLINMLKQPPEDMSLEDQSAAVLGYLGEMAGLARTDEATKMVADSLEEYDLFVNRIGYDPMLKESLLEAANALAALQDWQRPEEQTTPEPEPIREPEPEAEIQPEPEPEEVEETSPAESATETHPSHKKETKEPGRTMRISEERVDVFLSYVGELIAVDEMLRYIHSEMVRNNSDLQISSSLLRIVNTFTKLSDDLQASIMEIRKISVKPMLQKTQRIARDIAATSGKLIDTRIQGEEVTIDRSLVETLEAPMVHMIRNAADHGIESPEERIENGKEERGMITVSIRETEEEIILSIGDNGRGLNFEGIRQKAVKMGLLAKGAPINEEVLKDVVFASGFSMAEKVTDVSGRGVGMDAVKRSVADAGGQIDIYSEAEKGSEFRIRLPKSVGTQILASFVVQIGEERFVLPMEKVSGSFKSNNNFNRLPSGTVCVRRNDLILPVICLDGPYSGPLEYLSDGLLVTIENRDNPYAFFVNTILGMQKVVLRSIPWLNAAKFLGAAIMGDGRVSMIVNVDALSDFTEEEHRVTA